MCILVGWQGCKVRPRAICWPFLLAEALTNRLSSITNKICEFSCLQGRFNCHILVRVSQQAHLSFSSLLFALSSSASWLTRYAFKIQFLVFIL